MNIKLNRICLPENLFYKTGIWTLLLCLFLSGCQQTSYKSAGPFRYQEGLSLNGASEQKLAIVLEEMAVDAFNHDVEIAFHQFDGKDGFVQLKTNQQVDASFTRACRLLLEKLSIEVFDHKPFDLRVVNKDDKAALEVPYEEREVLGHVKQQRDIKGYTQNSPEQLASLLTFLSKDDHISSFTINMLQLNQQNGAYIFHVMIPEQLIAEPSLANELRYLSLLIHQNITQTPVHVHLCDELFRTKQVIRYGE